MKKRITVKGTGSQAPYGIGEIITDFPATRAGAKKAWLHAHKWYTPASIHIPINTISRDALYILADTLSADYHDFF